MFRCVLEMRMSLVIWILSFCCLVSSQDLRLSSSPTTLTRGQNVTLICEATFDIGSDPIVWMHGGTQVLDTQSSGAHISTGRILTGKWNYTTDSHTHNLTFTIYSGDVLGPWACKSNTKTLTSNEVNIKLESTTSTSAPSLIIAVSNTQLTSSPSPEYTPNQSSTISVRSSENTSTRLNISTHVTSGHSVNVSSASYVSTTSGQGSNGTSGLTKPESNEAIYIAVGSSVGVAVLITVITIIVCCMLKKKRRDTDEDKVIEENVLYMSSSLCEEPEGHMSQVGPLYASINKPKHISTEGVYLDDLYAKPNKLKPGDIGGVQLDELYAKPNKTRKQVA